MKITTLLPMRFNDGTKVSKKLRDEILASAFDTFGGYTLGSKQKGAWRAPDGTRYDDETERLDIVCDDVSAAQEWVRWVGKMLDQKAMYFEVHTSEVKFLEP